MKKTPSISFYFGLLMTRTPAQRPPAQRTPGRSPLSSAALNFSLYRSRELIRAEVVYVVVNKTFRFSAQ